MQKVQFPYRFKTIDSPPEAFPELHKLYYPMLNIGLFLVPTTLIKLAVLIDSGSQYCFFDKGYAEQLGIDNLKSGDEIPVAGVGGKDGKNKAYFHTVELVIFTDNTFTLKKSLRYSTKVGFLERSIGIAGILGGVGFFDHFLVEFNRPGGCFALSPLFPTAVD